ncbi:MAG: ribonuclease E/G, partial [Paracoccaceae bacterium]|nr:ribonuclease E/G [Paracoccaceae bacterium]
MLIDATHPEETRVVVADGSKVDEFDFESINKRQLAGNIYLAKVTRVEPSLQAAFVEYGGNRHGFLAFSEIHPDYYQIPVADREALIAEAAAAGDPSDDDEPKEKKKRPRRNSRGRGRKKKVADDATVEGEAAVAEGEAPAADGEAEVTASDAAPVETPETAGDAPTEEAVAVAETVEAPAEETAEAPQAEEAPAEEPAVEVAAEEPAPETVVAAETPDEETSADDDDPKTIAESAGADDGESISEPVEDEGAPSKTPEAAEEAPAETISEDASAEAPAVAEETAEATEETTVEETTVEEAKDATAEENSDVEAPEAEAKSDDKDADADDADGPSPKDEVESVGAEDVQDEVRPRRINYRRYKIQEVIKVRQILLVQVVKEERGNKGAALTTYLSLAGRYCVLMPNTARGGGISRKITNAADRKKLKEIATTIIVPEGAGLIVRTAGAKRTKTEIKRDYEYLQRMWEQIRELTLKSSAPAAIYEEGDLIKRSIRDLYNRDIDEVLVEG